MKNATVVWPVCRTVPLMPSIQRMLVISEPCATTWPDVPGVETAGGYVLRVRLNFSICWKINGMKSLRWPSPTVAYVEKSFIRPASVKQCQANSTGQSNRYALATVNRSPPWHGPISFPAGKGRKRFKDDCRRFETPG